MLWVDLSSNRPIRSMILTGARPAAQCCSLVALYTNFSSLTELLALEAPLTEMYTGIDALVIHIYAIHDKCKLNVGLHVNVSHSH